MICICPILVDVDREVRHNSMCSASSGKAQWSLDWVMETVTGWRL